MDFPHGETVTVRSVTTSDNGLGDSTTTTTDTSWGPCAVWDRTLDRFGRENADSHAPAIVVGLAIAGPRIAINSDDLVIRGDVTYQVDGPPQENTVSPFTGWDPGIVVNLKRAGAV